MVLPNSVQKTNYCGQNFHSQGSRHALHLLWTWKFRRKKIYVAMIQPGKFLISKILGNMVAINFSRVGHINETQNLPTITSCGDVPGFFITELLLFDGPPA